MTRQKLTERKLRKALRRAIMGLRSLDGMTGSVEVRSRQIRVTGYAVCEALGIWFPGYQPLREAEDLLRTGKFS